MRANVFYCPTAMDGVNVMNNWVGSEDKKPTLEKNRSKLLNQFERATKKAAEDEKLLANLPRRQPDLDKHQIPENPWFGPEKVTFTIEEFKPRLDTKTLFALNWKFGGTAARDKRGETKEVLGKLFDEWIERCMKEGWIQPQGICAVLPCQSDGEEVVVYDLEDRDKEIVRFKFDLVIGAGRKDTICAADYYYPKGSGKYDALGLQISTCGAQVDDAIAEFRANNDSESTLYLQGLSDRVAEDLGDSLHNMLKERLGYGPKHGIRWSPGYAAISDTFENDKILKILGGEQLGVKLTDAGEFSPTGTTAAVVCFHPDARYT
jgi:5-methyltetrahydrofolate--homocysteine methyltransferase